MTWSCRAASACLASLMSWCVPDMLTTLPVASRTETPRPRVHTHSPRLRTRAVKSKPSASCRADLTAVSTVSRSSGCTSSRKPEYAGGKRSGPSPKSSPSSAEEVIRSCSRSHSQLPIRAIRWASASRRSLVRRLSTISRRSP